MEEFEFEVITVDAQGTIIERKNQRARQFLEKLSDTVALEMVAVPGGIFMMGSPGRYGYDDERPVHPVSIVPFLMSKTPITQEQWRAVTGKTPSCRCPGAKRPVDRVTWQDAQKFCQRLIKITGKAYRLPGEAEWEYACRAGTSTPFTYGPTITTDLANYCGDHLFAGEPKGIYRHESTNVDCFPPNGFGLLDMHGNVWEWCQDEWHDDYSGAPVDGQPWESGFANFRVVRGGSWHEPPTNCRSSVRLKYDQSEMVDLVGFRIALSQGS
jgi:formylglycine-generating enzyme required for sulfatase activity